MNKARFLELVRDPDKLEFFDLEKLEEVVANFPYFQAAHLLIAKLAKAESSMFASEKLNMAAVCTLDRKKLKKWMQSKPRTLSVFVNHHVDSELISDNIAKENQSITIVEKVPLEIDKVKVESVTEEVNELPSFEAKIVELVKVEVKLESNSEQSAEQLTAAQNITIEVLEEESKSNEIVLEEVVELPVNLTYVEQSTMEAEAVVPATKPVEFSKIDLTTPLEPVEETNNVQKQDFYTELENNLKLLRQNKEEAKRTQEKEIIIEETPAPKLTIAVEDLEVKNQSIEIPKTNLEESRLEEILRKDIDDKNKFLEKDLLIEYFNYLSQRRVARLNDKKSVNNLIDKFITNEPTIPKLKPNAVKVPLIDLSEKSTKPITKIVSENFAKILAQQGKLDKAIEMYETLGLKYPEKKAYFANLILELNNKK